MSTAEKFLHDFQSRPLPVLTPRLRSEKLILGQGKDSLEVAVLTSNHTPKTLNVKDAQKKRKSHRASPVLLTVIHGDNQASIVELLEKPLPFIKIFNLILLKSFVGQL